MPIIKKSKILALGIIKKIKTSKGFTLIELLTVVTILGILISFSTISFVSAQQKGRDGKRKTDLQTIKQALTLYYRENGSYPPGGNCAAADYHSDDTGNGFWIPGLGIKYIENFPKDPAQTNSFSIFFAKNILPTLDISTPVYAGGGGGGGGGNPGPNGHSYMYSVFAGCSAYVLWASLESSNDAQLVTNSNATCHLNPPVGSANGYSYAYNYCVIQD